LQQGQALRASLELLGVLRDFRNMSSRDPVHLEHWRRCAPTCGCAHQGVRRPGVAGLASSSKLLFQHYDSKADDLRRPVFPCFKVPHRTQEELMDDIFRSPISGSPVRLDSTSRSSSDPGWLQRDEDPQTLAVAGHRSTAADLDLGTGIADFLIISCVGSLAACAGRKHRDRCGRAIRYREYGARRSQAAAPILRIHQSGRGRFLAAALPRAVLRCGDRFDVLHHFAHGQGGSR